MCSAKKKRMEDWREGGKKNINNKLGSGGQGERASTVGHLPPSSTLSSGLCLALQGTKLLTGTTVLSSEYFRALKMLQSVKVWKLFYSKVEDWNIPSHFLSSLGSQLRRC